MLLHLLFTVFTVLNFLASFRQEETAALSGGEGHRRVAATRSGSAATTASGGSRERRRKQQRRATITGAWAELHNIQRTQSDSGQLNTADPENAERRNDSDLAMDKGRLLANLLLKVCSPQLPATLDDDNKPSSSNHSPSDQGIYMDSSGSEVAVAKTTDSKMLRGNGSDSAHSSTHSPSSTTDSSSESLSLVYEVGVEEEAVSLAYIDESRTVHKYIASRWAVHLLRQIHIKRDFLPFFSAFHLGRK